MDFHRCDLRHRDQHHAEFDPLIGVHREVHAILTERGGADPASTPPELPSEPPQAGLQRELLPAPREQFWTQSSRAFQTANAAWRHLGAGSRRSPLTPVAFQEGARIDP